MSDKTVDALFECGTCKGKGEHWRDIQGGRYAHGIVKCVDCLGTGYEIPNALLDALLAPVRAALEEQP